MTVSLQPILPARPAQLKAQAGGKPQTIQAKMESVFGTSFADVRIHEGPEASSIGALAFTQGSSISFAPGQYNPNTSQGQRLLGQQPRLSLGAVVARGRELLNSVVTHVGRRVFGL